MNKLLYMLSLILIISISNAEEHIHTFEEDINCDFNKIILDGKSEDYPHVVGIVLEKSNNKILVKPIYYKKYNKIIIYTKKWKNFSEEVEFFILNDYKVCIK